MPKLYMGKGGRVTTQSRMLSKQSSQEAEKKPSEAEWNERKGSTCAGARSAGRVTPLRKL